MDDTLELREELADAWRAVLNGAVERGCPPQAVVETMATVAHERFSDLFGPQAAASYLQLLAEQLRQIERNETVSLVRGEQEAPEPPEQDTVPFSPAWISGESLL